MAPVDDVSARSPRRARTTPPPRSRPPQAAFAAWSRLPLAARGAYLTAAAASLERRADEIARDMSTEMGKPLREARGETLRAAQILRYSASEAYRPVGEHFEQSADRQPGLDPAAPRRCRRADHAVELPDRDPGVEARARADLRQHRRAEARLRGAAAPACTSPRRSRRPSCRRACSTSLTGRGSTVGAALVRDPRVRAISFTGSVATGHGVRDEATSDRQARAARARRPQPADRDGGRRSRPRRRGRVRRRVLVGRPEVHRDAPHLRAGRACTTRFARRCSRASSAGASAIRSTWRSRSARSSTSRSSTRSSTRSSAAARGRHGRHRRRARATTTAYLIPPTVFEGVARRRVPLLRGGVRAGDVAVPLRRRSTRRSRARTRSRSGSRRAIFTSSLATATRFQNEAQAGLIHVNSQTAGAEVHVPFGGIKSAASARTSRAAPRSSSTPRRSRSTSTPERLRGARRAERAVDDDERARQADERPEHGGRTRRSASRIAPSSERRQSPRACSRRRASSPRAPPPRPAGSAASSGSVIVSGKSGPIATPSSGRPDPAGAGGSTTPSSATSCSDAAPAEPDAPLTPVVGGPGDGEPDRDRDACSGPRAGAPAEPSLQPRST